MTARGAERPGEFDLIARLFAPLALDAGAFGLREDVALLRPPDGKDLVLKADAIVESIDFFRADPAAAVGQKAIRVNLSDLAAKGAVPHGYLMTLLLPGWPDRAWLEQFAEGLACDQAEFGLRLLGGDISSTPGPLAISIAAFGLIEHGALIRRAGAKPGDSVFVSGTIGDSAGGLSVLKGEAGAAGHQELIARYRIPSPRLELGRSLRAVASAALDVSDGLVADLEHLAGASDVAIVLDAMRIPVSPGLCELWGDTLETRVRAATSGDDYEIAFTASSRDAVMAAARQANIAVTQIGRVEAGRGIRLLDPFGNEIGLFR
ncbi:MAG TPA: thiamine-phosphate kinase, partial [Rhizomicrobium sp.]|nr:thiamine-phosphate kinase [Rhizomicrobium sp.]